MQPALEELIRQAAQGEVLHNDDTPMPVLGLEREGDREARDPPERKGVFTSGIVATQAGRRIALFFTGHRHAGENLASVLARRAQELGPPIQMCDALTRNLPKLPAKLEVIVSHCLAHARRRFVEVVANFPAGMPARAGDLGRGLRLRCPGPRTRDVRRKRGCTFIKSTAGR